MSERKAYNGSHLLVAFIGGAAAGAAVAYLTAPKSGREVRAQIGDYAKVGADKSKALPGAVKAAGSAAREAFGETIGEAGDTGAISEH